jgi:hypothetical protein
MGLWTLDYDSSAVVLATIQAWAVMELDGEIVSLAPISGVAAWILDVGPAAPTQPLDVPHFLRYEEHVGDTPLGPAGPEEEPHG